MKSSLYVLYNSHYYWKKSSQKMLICSLNLNLQQLQKLTEITLQKQTLTQMKNEFKSISKNGYFMYMKHVKCILPKEYFPYIIIRKELKTI